MQNTDARRCRNDIGRFWRVFVLTDPQQRTWSPKNKREVWYDSAAYKIFMSIISQYLFVGSLIGRSLRWPHVWRSPKIRIQMHWNWLLGWARRRACRHSWVHSHVQDIYEECFKSYQAISLQDKSVPCNIFFRNALQLVSADENCKTCLGNPRRR